MNKMEGVHRSDVVGIAVQRVEDREHIAQNTRGTRRGTRSGSFQHQWTWLKRTMHATIYNRYG